MEKMKNIFNKLNIEKILCIFIIITPILDIISFLSRRYFNTNYSVSIIIRPIIPLIVGLYIFLKEKRKKGILIILLLYCFYGFIHLFIYYSNLKNCSFGTVFQEARYIANYSFMVITLIIYLNVFKNYDKKELYSSILISNTVYIFSIFLAILTNTSSSSYIEGIGYKGWFESANSVGSVLIFSTTIILSRIHNINDIRKKIWSITIVIMNGVYLTTLIGTRVGLFGFFGLIIAYVVVHIVLSSVRKNNINKKNILIVFGILIIIFITAIAFGSNTINRRKLLDTNSEKVIDNLTNKKSHITGDLSLIYYKIKNNEIENNFMTNSQKQSIIDLYNYANEHEVKNTDNRMQQLIYHVFLVGNQKSMVLVLFGNGYLINTNELVLEMELISIILNFGLIGTVLYLGLFIYIFIKAIVIFVKNIKKVDEEFCMILIGNGLAYVFSTLAGYTFFNPSSMLLIILMAVILYNKTIQIRGD